MVFRIIAVTAAFLAFLPGPASARWAARQLAAPTAQAVAREGHVALPGVRLWCIDTGGSGPAVILLHAATGSSRVWEHQLGPFTTAGLRVVACDRRGYGRTIVDEGGTSDAAAADDVEQLIRALGLARVHLVGTAAGGIVALDVALSFPARLRSLVVANSIGGVQDADYVELGGRLRPSPQFEGLPAEFRELGPSYRAANPAGARRWLELERLSRAPGTAAARPPRMKNRITFAALETIAVPTLLLTGDADLYTPPSVLRLFAARITTSSTVIVPEAGHSAYWEQPERFNAAVLEFLRRH